MSHRSVLVAVLLCLPVPLLAQSAITLGTRVGLPTPEYDGQGRRDPFVPLVTPPTAAAATSPAPARRTPGLAGIAAADIERLKGIIASGTTRLALLAGPDGRTYLARAQDRLHDAVIRRIDVDAVVLLTISTPAGAGREVRKPLRPRAEGGGW